MEFRRPKIKKKSTTPRKSKLPVKGKKEIVGVFNGEVVTVRDVDSMIYLYEAGNFGKGTMSKGEPNYSFKKDDIPKIILQHQFENQAKWNMQRSYHQKFKNSGNCDLQLSLQSINSFLQFSFNDNHQESWKSWKESCGKEGQNLITETNCNKTALSFLEFKIDENNYEDIHFKQLVNNILESKQLKNPTCTNSESDEVIILTTTDTPHLKDFSSAVLNAELVKLPHIAEENLNLNLEESLFLKSVFGCLNIIDLSFSELDVSDLWEKFNAKRKNFTERYVTYHYYRSKGWIVKSGLKFGGDFLLYKNGPAHYHSSFLVKVLDGRQKLTWREFLAMNRLVETFNKDLVLSCVSSDLTVEKKTFPDVLECYSVQEVLVKRWFPSKESIYLKENQLVPFTHRLQPWTKLYIESVIPKLFYNIEENGTKFFNYKPVIL